MSPTYGVRDVDRVGLVELDAGPRLELGLGVVARVPEPRRVDGRLVFRVGVREVDQPLRRVPGLDDRREAHDGSAHVTVAPVE